MGRVRPNILTIAGFDPSNGAGLTADIKTFEKLKCYGLAVQTANTIQTDTDFVGCFWVDENLIKNQLETVLAKFQVDFAKIGIIENKEVLLSCISLLRKQNPEVKIVLDPILHSSTNFEFHKEDENVFDEVLEHIFLITPNYQEIEKLSKNKSVEEMIVYISSKTNLFLKGGHRKDNIGQDLLFMKNGKKFTINPKVKNVYEKHGSGCVLSSAITSYLALGFPLLKSCYKGKRYVERFLSSNETLLGYHR